MRKEDGIGREGPTRQPVHAKPKLQFFDAILTGLAPLVLPSHNLLGGTFTIRGNQRVTQAWGFATELGDTIPIFHPFFSWQAHALLAGQHSL